MSSEVARVVALGASNLTRGLPAVVAAARAAWGPEVQVLAALGHGRSYGARSRVGVRALPGILESGLWRALESLPACPTRAVVADVGNDIPYGVPPARILDWIDEALRRLQRATRDVVITELPLERIRRLSATPFLVFRSIFFPRCRLSLDQALERAMRVNAGLVELAAARGARPLRPDPRWYGVDPIHIRPSLIRTAWPEILGIPFAAGAKLSMLERLKLRGMPPERRWLLGMEQRRPQMGRVRFY
ncbi:MAG TPA: hypothetical protein VLH81_01200 [Desulfobacterales bacterium]|nr:hypothetical protein [Desulfobacterales bacterium]